MRQESGELENLKFAYDGHTVGHLALSYISNFFNWASNAKFTGTLTSR